LASTLPLVVHRLILYRRRPAAIAEAKDGSLLIADDTGGTI
jgi:glucose/arabinose dehydrogenase